jgi:hypothetical protein
MSIAVLTDPFYAATARVFGDGALVSAGYVREAPTANAEAHSAFPLCTPTHKLADTREDQVPLVLLCTGCYSPVHVGHLAMFERARTALTARGHVVAGGYLSPSHDDYVGIKNGGVAALPAAHRLHLCQAAVADSDFLMICPWEARWVATAVNFTDVILHLQKYLRTHWHPRTEVVYVCGADNAGFARAFVGRGRCILMEQAYTEGRVVVDDSDWGHVESSSDARASGVGIPPAVAATLSAWELDWSHIASGAPPQRESAPTITYTLRDDLDWATSHWRPRVSTSVLATALTTFRDGVADALRTAFTDVAWPDRPRALDLRVLNLTAQRHYIKELMQRERVLSLDLCVDAHEYLHLCREFALADGQLRSRQLRARPGYPPLHEQMQALEREVMAVTLVDDDIATGLTFASAQLLLESRGVEVVRTLSLLDNEGPRPHDVVDLRDFLVGARDGGLVVRVGGEFTRAPYLLPWVALTTRAKIPPSAEWALSRQLWQLNVDFFTPLQLQVADAHSSSHALLRAVGARGGELLADFCARERARTEHLPFSSESKNDLSNTLGAYK